MSPFDTAIARFDDYNRQDPNKEAVGGQMIAKELIYARRMSDCLMKFAPEAPEEVRLAAHCQHIGRWQIPRSTYPADRKGYLMWRNKLKDHHAAIAGDILKSADYDAGMIEKVKFLLLKKELYSNQQTQLLEDIVCLVFIEFYLADFAAKHDDDKVIDILRKTMKKMTKRATDTVLEIPLDDATRTLIIRAASL